VIKVCLYKQCFGGLTQKVNSYGFKQLQEFVSHF